MTGVHILDCGLSQKRLSTQKTISDTNWEASELGFTRQPVLGILIRTRRVLGLLGPDPDLLVRGTDPYPAPDPSLFS